MYLYAKLQDEKNIEGKSQEHDDEENKYIDNDPNIIGDHTDI